MEREGMDRGGGKEGQGEGLRGGGLGRRGPPFEVPAGALGTAGGPQTASNQAPTWSSDRDIARLSTSRPSRTRRAAASRSLRLLRLASASSVRPRPSLRLASASSASP